MVNTSGRLWFERDTYTPYGVLTVRDASGTPVSGNTSAFGWQYYFQGGRLDEVTGNVQFAARDYDPTTGVWTQPDPIGLKAGDLNDYRFVGGNPVNATDPSGLYRVTWNGPWSEDQKEMVRMGFQDIATRVSALIKIIDAEKKSLSPSQLAAVGTGLDHLRAILYKVDQNMSNKNYVIDLYQAPMNQGWWTGWAPDNNNYMKIYGDANSWKDPDLYFNTLPGRDGNRWWTLPQEEFNTLLLHELTHLHGSEDMKQRGTTYVSPPWVMNAQMIERLMNGRLDTIGPYLTLKLRAASN